MELVERMLGGAVQPLSRLISLVERGSPEVIEFMKAIYPRQSFLRRSSRPHQRSTTRNVMKLLDAFGSSWRLWEWGSLSIMETVDTTMLALVPEAGDAIQTMKAGLMGIADIFVVNKADRPGGLRMELESMLMLRRISGNHPS